MTSGSWCCRVLLGALLTVGCSTVPLTQIVVVADTDLLVPTQVDRIEISIEPPMGPLSTRFATLSGDGASTLPATLGVVHRAGPFGPVHVLARAMLGDVEVVRREAQLEFVMDHTVTLRVDLEASCVGRACEEEQTCAGGTCRSWVITREELMDFTGTIPRLGEAGVACPPNELCNGVDDDCDHNIDEGFDLTNDPDNCGACANRCASYTHSRGSCRNGQCAIACDESWGDCDSEVRSGCEAPLNTTTMCQSCGTPCEIDHGVPECFTGICQVDTCALGWGDCNHLPADGCESPLNTPEHCRACDTPCTSPNAIASCGAGSCRVVECMPGFADCNMSATDGCERSINTVSDCAGCGDACPAIMHGTASCTSGQCGIASCETGWADCDHNPLTGCEARLDSMADCGACGVACALANGSESCTSGSCQIVSCDAAFRDCNMMASDGCERSIETASDCGACDRACGGATPLCSEDGSGTRMCRSTCQAGETLCGMSCVDLTSSLAHCGGCDRACTPAHAMGTCTASGCAIMACDPGWDDCNSDVRDGCETPLDTLTDCGACRAACSLGGTTHETCMGGRCQIGGGLCDPLRQDCDGTPDNGCETALDTSMDCGACGASCDFEHASESCSTGTCTLGTCEPGWRDCNRMAIDGCERALNTLSDCRDCDDVCDLSHASESCSSGSCALGACDSDEWGDCNTLSSDGCERNLRTLTDCSACGRGCGPLMNATASCATGSCSIESCSAGFGDCDTNPTTGCERPLDTTADCGACGVTCSGPAGTPAECSTGVCHAVCPVPGRPNFYDCNGVLADGCETNIRNNVSHCGMCGNACPPGMRCMQGGCR